MKPSPTTTSDRTRCWSRWDTLAILLYAAVVSLELIWHKPWADEAQAWLIARSLGFWQIVSHGVRYESSPALWHCFLHLLVLLHVSYAGMGWVAAFLAGVGIVIFLRWSPFPAVLRVLLPLTFWLAYQDAVIARSYVLFTPLGFAAAALLRNRVRRPVLLAVVLALCANLSLHGFIAAIGLAAVAAVQAIRDQRLQKGPALWRHPRWAAALLILLAGAVLAVYSAYPPSDDSSPTARNLARSVEKIRDQLHGRPVAQAPLLAHTVTSQPGQLLPLPYPHHHPTPLQAFHLRMARILGTITFPLSQVGLFGLVLFGSLCWAGFHSSAGGDPGPLGWIGLIPYLLLVLIFTSMYLAPRHCGMLMMGFLIAWWLVWPATSQPLSRGHRIAAALLIVMSIEQIGWTVHALVASMHTPSDPGAATAAFLRRDPRAAVDGFYYHSIDVLPYFSHNIYVNQSSPYWLWSTRQHIDRDAPAAIAKHPGILVVAGWNWGPRDSAVSYDWIRPYRDLNSIWNNDRYGIAAYAEAHGYRQTNAFCGDQFMRFGYSERTCNIILEPEAAKP